MEENKNNQFIEINKSKQIKIDSIKLTVNEKLSTSSKIDCQNDTMLNSSLDNVNKTIQKALNHLQNNNFSDYFGEMDKIIPEHLRTQFVELQDHFITGNYTPYFSQQLKTFAQRINQVL